MGLRIGRVLAKILIGVAVIVAVMAIYNIPHLYVAVKIGVLIVGAALASVIGELQ